MATKSRVAPETRRIMEVVRTQGYLAACQATDGRWMLEDEKSITFKYPDGEQRIITLQDDMTLQETGPEDKKPAHSVTILGNGRTPMIYAENLYRNWQKHLREAIRKNVGQVFVLPEEEDLYEQEDELRHHRQVMKALQNTADRALGTAGGGVLHQNSAYAYAVLRRIIGEEHINAVTSLATRPINHSQYNIITQNLGPLLDASSKYPNSVRLYVERIESGQTYENGSQVVKDIMRQNQNAMNRVASESPAHAEQALEFRNENPELYHSAEGPGIRAVTATALIESVHPFGIRNTKSHGGLDDTGAMIRTALLQHIAGVPITPKLTDIIMRLSHIHDYKGSENKYFSILSPENWPIVVPLIREIHRTRGKPGSNMTEKVIRALQLTVFRKRESGRGLAGPETGPEQFADWAEILEMYRHVPEDQDYGYGLRWKPRLPEKKQPHRQKSPQTRTLTSRDLYPIVQDILEQHFPSFRKGLAQVTGQAGKSVQLRLAGQDQPTLSLTRRDNGTITAEGHDTSLREAILDAPDGISSQGAVARHIENTLVREIRKNWQQWGQPDASPPTVAKAAAAINRLLERELPHARHQWHDQSISANIQALLSTMVDPETVRRAAERGIDRVNINAYNIAALMDEAELERFIATNSLAYYWAVRHLEESQELNHPGQIVALARDNLGNNGMKPQTWRAASRFLEREETNRLVSTCYIEDLVNALNIIAEAGQPVPADKLQQLMYAGALQAVNPKAENADIRRHNRRTLAVLYLRHAAEDEQEDEGINNVSDYVQEQTSLGQRITSRKFSRLIRYSAQWHREMGREERISGYASRARKRLEQIQETGHDPSWPSALREFQHSTVQFRALLSESQLCQETIAMRHCVYSYADQCARGTSRIFSIIERDQHAGTVELTREGGRWTVAQIRGRANARLQLSDKNATEKLLEAYVEATRNRNGSNGNNAALAAQAA